MRQIVLTFPDAGSAFDALKILDGAFEDFPVAFETEVKDVEDDSEQEEE